MRSPENIQKLAELVPDYMGFIFWEHSKRFVSGSTPEVNEGIKKTGVFVNASLDYIKACIATHQLKAIQLHGSESPVQCSALKNTGIEVIKAFAVSNGFDFNELQAYETTCDYFLFDTKGELPGGNGMRFDWSVLKAYPSQKPFFLSGGIGPDDSAAVASIIKLNLPLYAVDINSKFEIEPGLKNIESIKEFKERLYNEISS